MDIAFQIKAWRLASGLSKSEFARELGITVRALNYYESGQRTPPLKRWFEISERFSNGHKPTDA